MGLERLASLVRRLLMVVGGAALILLVLLATGNVALRIFGVPLSGAYEVVSFLGAIVIASALGYTQHEKDHIVVDILSGKFPAPVRRALDAASYALSGVLFAIVAWRVFAWGRGMGSSGEVSETLKIAYHPFVYAVALGFAALALTLFLDFLREVLGKGEKP